MTFQPGKHRWTNLKPGKAPGDVRTCTRCKRTQTWGSHRDKPRWTPVGIGRCTGSAPQSRESSQQQRQTPTSQESHPMKTLTSIAEQFLRDMQSTPESALDLALASIQTLLGIRTGDIAGAHFSGSYEAAIKAAGLAGNLTLVMNYLRGYIRAEQVASEYAFKHVLSS